MSKKFLISIGILLSLVFSFSVCFANEQLNTAANDVKNVVGGAENTVEGAAKNVANSSKNTTASMENGMNNGYDTSRLSTQNNTMFGMNSSTWTWLAIGIAAVVIIGFVWYLSMQYTNNHHNNNNNNGLD